MSDSIKSESADWEESQIQEFDSESDSECPGSDSERVSPQPGQFTQDLAAIAAKLELPHQVLDKK
ncbi:hypothetical protein DPMN_018941 [Dreissena polymorpha]|uniref:Uncharacterized protein n=1 Tax=Dreissena polymorpha TaxID=45954 RepID=A0A9D4S9P5_DREPO|nr:hypothetical protein DPMN_018941 [Dreissena polymorpha]